MRRDREFNRASAGESLRSPDQQTEPDESCLAQLLVERPDEFIIWISPDARLLYGNPAICIALGYSQAEFSTLYLADISPGMQQNWPARVDELKQNLTQTFVAELRTSGGEIIPVRFNANYVGGKQFVLCCGRDLRAQQTDPKQAAAARVDAIFVLKQGHVENSEGGDSELFGGSRQQIIDELESMLSESGPRHGATERALGGEEVVFDWQTERPDGSCANIECTLCRIEIAGHVRLLAVAVDVTATLNSKRTLAQLSARLLEMQDEERRRIARELHDTTGQNLGALSINLSMIRAKGVNPEAKEALEESVALVDCCIREVRTMSYLLHPPLLDELGLASALRAYSAGYAERTGIPVNLDLPPNLPRLPQAIEIALFRIVQEGLSNIHRHSGSQRATLRLKHQQDRVQLELIDYGRGFPPGTLEWDATSASHFGVGIAGIQERARLLGGRLTIASGEAGTALSVVLPLTSAKS